MWPKELKDRLGCRLSDREIVGMCERMLPEVEEIARVCLNAWGVSQLTVCDNIEFGNSFYWKTRGDPFKRELGAVIGDKVLVNLTNFRTSLGTGFDASERFGLTSKARMAIDCACLLAHECVVHAGCLSGEIQDEEWKAMVFSGVGAMLEGTDLGSKELRSGLEEESLVVSSEGMKIILYDKSGAPVCVLGRDADEVFAMVLTHKIVKMLILGRFTNGKGDWGNYLVESWAVGTAVKQESLLSAIQFYNEPKSVGCIRDYFQGNFLANYVFSRPDNETFPLLGDLLLGLTEDFYNGLIASVNGNRPR